MTYWCLKKGKRYFFLDKRFATKKAATLFSKNAVCPDLKQVRKGLYYKSYEQLGYSVVKVKMDVGTVLKPSLRRPSTRKGRIPAPRNPE